MAAAPHTDRVAQAAKVVAEQAHCTLPEAFLLIDERSTETGRSLEEIANEVLEQEIRFDT
jgi:AmiR/NasT family two-component response regulator